MASAVNVCKSCFISKSLNESLGVYSSRFKKKGMSFKSSPLANANFGLIYDETKKKNSNSNSVILVRLMDENIM